MQFVDANIYIYIYIGFGKEGNKKILNLILVIIRLSKCKNIFAKVYIPSWTEEVFVIKKVKDTVLCSVLLIVILMQKKLLERFTKKNCKSQIKQSLELKKESREKMISYMANGKSTIIHVAVGS